MITNGMSCKTPASVPTNDHAPSRCCICIMNSEYANGRNILYIQPLINNIFTACEDF